MIPVTKPYLPPMSKYQRYLDGIYERQWLTNFGPLTEELTHRLEDYLGVKNLLLVANGTLALQLAYRALSITGSAITTPYTFVATSSSLKWEGIHPVFSDIEMSRFNLDPRSIQSMYQPDCSAIVPVHVYGNPCDVEKIDSVANKLNLKVIYDAAHAFGVKFKGKSILSYGDASTLSLHATKVFHSTEGGGIIFKNKEDLERATQMINFGINTSNGIIENPGINAKMSELHAAMGLSVLDDIDNIINRRIEIITNYERTLDVCAIFPKALEDATRNGAYAPIVLESNAVRNRVFQNLKEHGILSRPYFYPALHNSPTFHSSIYGNYPNASYIADRVLCLPPYYDLSKEDQAKICRLVMEAT
ncbi:DegT/DnrJ/EryC1/StrS family aminotransferase [Bdellovibrio bacteriovorus]|uniref:DegT/DnrJ/EryC1/StrS family aminotransferase n=1 Tax=Bdellovibrio bacteriovorus TaxID=959 RepID=UPI0035A6C301